MTTPKAGAGLWRLAAEAGRWTSDQDLMGGVAKSGPDISQNTNEMRLESG